MPIMRRTLQTGFCLASALLSSQQALAASTERVSVDSAGVQANDSSSSRAISADGRFVAFQSDASNLVAGDSNTSPDVFVRDRMTGTTERVSVATGGAQGNGSSTFASISGDGRFVVFSSGSTNLVAGDSNARWDIFLRDRKTGTTTIVSRNTAGVQADGNCYDPAISADGRFVAFHSFATNLAAGDTNSDWDVFVRACRPTRRNASASVQPKLRPSAAKAATPASAPTGGS
jgi:Tol biopolymer transport system component